MSWGSKVTRSKNGIFLSQRKYVLNLLYEIRFKPCSTPMVSNLQLKKVELFDDPKKYRTLVGKLSYDTSKYCLSWVFGESVYVVANH